MPKLTFPVAETYENAGADTSVSEGTQVTSSASSNTKGSFVQLIGATSHAGAGLFIVLGGANVSGRGFLVDIAVGAGGSEQVILPNLYYYSQQDPTMDYAYVPIAIPKNSRISARSQSTTGSNYVRVNCIVVSGESGYPQSALDYGSTTASTTGTQVNTSGSNNTKGAWTQITAATTRSHFWGLICVRAVSGTQFLLDVGIGGAGSEQVIVPNLNIRDSSNGDPAMWSVPLRIPSGTRVAMRAAAATGSSNVSANLVLL